MGALQGVLTLAPGTPQAMDLSAYIDVADGSGLDPANPEFSNRIFSHSLLKEGGTLALEQLALKETVWPLKLYTASVQQTNLCPNGSFEHDALNASPAGWSSTAPGWWLVSGATPAASPIGAYAGSNACQVQSTGVDQGIACALGVLPAGTYTASMFVTGVGAVALTMFAGITSPGTGDGSANFTASNPGAMHTINFTSDGATPSYVGIRQNGAGSITYYLDAVMVTAGASAVPYADGDSGGWYWTGSAGASASTTYFGRDGASHLVQQLNNLVNTPGQTFSWQDVGASQPTYFDLASGQFDVHYSFRKAGANGAHWIQGNLRLFSMPLGRTATTRLLASAAGTGPLLMLPIPSAILGDAPALIQANVNTGLWPGNRLQSDSYRTAVSVLPYGYVPEFQSASMYPGASTIVGASGAVASQYRTNGTMVVAPVNPTAGFPIAQVTIPAGYYLGTNRVFLVGRLASNGVGTTVVYQSVPSGPNYGIASQTLGSWQLIDIGTFTIPSSFPNPSSFFLQVFGDHLSLNGATYVAKADFTDLIVLPDSQTVFVQGPRLPPTQNSSLASTPIYFDGIANETSFATPAYALQRLTPYQRGTIPKLTTAPSQQIAVVMLANQGTATSPTVAAPANDLISASISVRERVRFEF